MCVLGLRRIRRYVETGSGVAADPHRALIGERTGEEQPVRRLGDGVLVAGAAAVEFLDADHGRRAEEPRLVTPRRTAEHQPAPRRGAEDIERGVGARRSQHHTGGDTGCAVRVIALTGRRGGSRDQADGHHRGYGGYGRSHDVTVAHRDGFGPAVRQDDPVTADR